MTEFAEVPEVRSATPRLAKTAAERETQRRVIVVLDGAPLEVVKVGGKSAKDARHHLLNSDDHAGVLRRHGRPAADMRPDIAHQCLLTLLDSPLNKAGLLSVFVRTARGVLIEVNPQIRIPRTYPRFAGLMVQLLAKLSIRAVGSSEKLLNVIRNPVTDHLPVGARRVAMSADGPRVRLADWAAEHRQTRGDGPVVFFVGAIAHGADDFEGAEERLSVSEYALSASTVCSRICHVYEDLWGVQ